MNLTGLFKRGAACLCTAALLMGGISAFALSPALPDEPAPAELSEMCIRDSLWGAVAQRLRGLEIGATQKIL